MFPNVTYTFRKSKVIDKKSQHYLPCQDFTCLVHVFHFISVFIVEDFINQNIKESCSHYFTIPLHSKVFSLSLVVFNRVVVISKVRVIIGAPPARHAEEEYLFQMTMVTFNNSV